MNLSSQQRLRGIGPSVRPRGRGIKLRGSNKERNLFSISIVDLAPNIRTYSAMIAGLICDNIRYAMQSPTQAIGEIAERAVLLRMKELGFTFLDRNFTISRLGELDLVFFRAQTLYVVEVKSRNHRNIASWGPESAFTLQKIRRVRRTAEIYRIKKGLSRYSLNIVGAWVTHNDDKRILSIVFFPILQ